MIDEQFMEDCIEECPKAFLGCELKVVERQALLGGFRPDLICDYQQETWIVEIQQRALDRTHLYKCLEYRDLLKQTKNGRTVRVVVVCNSIDKKYLPLAETHDVEIVTIERDKFIDLASQFCPRSVSRLIKRRDKPEIVASPRLTTKYHFRPLGWSEQLSLTDILAHIHTECGRNNVGLAELRKERYWSIMHEVENLICRDWQHSLIPIVNPEKWSVDRLLSNPAGWQPDFVRDTRRIRKPALEITVIVTIKHNLSVVWHPKTTDHNHRGLYKVGDWAQWPGQESYGWSRPANELMFIREINRLRPGAVQDRFEPETCNWDVLDELFITLIKAAYDWLCQTLSSIVNVEKVADFEFQLVDPSPGDFNENNLVSKIRRSKRIVGWSIFNLEARRMELEQSWIDGFEKQYGVSLQRIIEAYNICLSRGRNRVASKRTTYIAADFQKEHIHISRPQLEEILTRIRKHHHHYSSFLTD